MLFGDKAAFAVQFDASAPAEGAGLLECHFTYWIGGRPVGNLAFEALVSEVAEDLRHVLVDGNDRRDDGLFLLPARELVELFGYWRAGEPEHSQRAIDDRWSAHDISYSMGHGYPPGEGKEWSVYLIENGQSGRVVFHEQSEQSQVFEQPVPVGYVDGVLRAALGAMND